MPPQQSVEST